MESMTLQAHRSIYFQYQDRFFEQIEGAAMDSPLSALLKTAIKSAQLQPKEIHLHNLAKNSYWNTSTPNVILISSPWRRNKTRRLDLLEKVLSFIHLDIKRTHTDRYLNFHNVCRHGQVPEEQTSMCVTQTASSNEPSAVYEIINSRDIVILCVCLSVSLIDHYRTSTVGSQCLKL